MVTDPKQINLHADLYGSAILPCMLLTATMCPPPADTMLGKIAEKQYKQLTYKTVHRHSYRVLRLEYSRDRLVTIL